MNIFFLLHKETNHCTFVVIKINIMMYSITYLSKYFLLFPTNHRNINKTNLKQNKVKKKIKSSYH
jgi:hypothetical protein